VRLVAVRLTIDFLRKHETSCVLVSENIHSDFSDLVGNVVSREQEASLFQAVLLPFST
jgi:hypothetical protein